MKLKHKKVLFQSFFIAFIVSFFFTLLLFPDIGKLFYTNVVGAKVVISSGTLIEASVVLSVQTGVIGTIFYSIAKKIFLPKNEKFNI